MVHMAPFVLGLEDLLCLSRRYPSRTTRVMFGNKTGEGFTHNEADIQWLAGIGA
jgi:hypothetical protein